MARSNVAFAAQDKTIRGKFGALIIRIGCWGPLYKNDNKEPPK